MSPERKKLAEFEETSEPYKSVLEDAQKLMYFWIRSPAGSRRARRTSESGCSRMTSQVRWMTRPTPVWPTNMWCASSVSMKRQVRASGSKPDSASASSWNLPSRSVNIVKQKNDSQSSQGSLNVPRMRGWSGLPERRSSSSSASSRPSFPK